MEEMSDLIPPNQFGVVRAPMEEMPDLSPITQNGAVTAPPTINILRAERALMEEERQDLSKNKIKEI
jgi:hypothetical protein